MALSTIVKSLPTQTIQVTYRPLQSFQIFLDKLPVDPTTTYKKPTKILSRPHATDSEPQMSLLELCATIIIMMTLIFLLIKLLGTFMDVTLHRFPETFDQPRSYLQGLAKKPSSRATLERRCRNGKGSKEGEDGYGQELQANEARLFVKKPGTNGSYTEESAVSRRRSG